MRLRAELPDTEEANFNPRTPYGMRHPEQADSDKLQNFNPRTPYGMRLLTSYSTILTRYFNPRTPYGMRQGFIIYDIKDFFISIHAPLTGCDYEH